MKKLFVALLVLVSTLSFSQSSDSTLNRDSIIKHLHIAINEYRLAAPSGLLDTLAYDTTQIKGAVWHSYYMAYGDTLTHAETDTTNPYYSLDREWNDREKSGIENCVQSWAYITGPINTKFYKETAENIVAVWDGSYRHKAAIKNIHNTTMGCGLALLPYFCKDRGIIYYKIYASYRTK